MSYQTMTSNIDALLDEAADARMLAATFINKAAILDLLNYAASLEADASRMREDPTLPPTP